MKEEFLKAVFEYQALIHKVCRMYRDSEEDRQDLFQEIIYQLWKSYPSYKGEAKFSSWLYRISLNTAMASFRKPSLPLSSGLEGLEQLPDPGSTDKDERLDSLFYAIRQLPELDRGLMALYLEGMRYAEIADIMGISENNVGVRLNRIKHKIKQMLKV